MNNQKTKNNSFVKQAAILAAAGLIARVLGFAYRIPITNIVGDDGNGVYALAYNIYNFLLILSSAGIPAAISKMVAEQDSIGEYKESHRIFHASLLFVGGIGLFFSCWLFFFPNFFIKLTGDPRSYYSLISLAPTVFVVAVMAVFRGYFQGKMTMIPTAVSQIIEQIFNAIFSIVLVIAFMKINLPVSNKFYGDKNALGAAGNTTGTGIGAVMGLLFLLGVYFLMRPLIMKESKKGTKRTEYLKLIKKVISITVPFIAGAAIYSFSNIIDSLMVRSRLITAGYDSSQATSLFGIYNGKFITLTTLPVAVSAAIAMAAIPSIAASVKKSGFSYIVIDKINTSLRLAMLICIPSAIGLMVLGDPILHMLFYKAPAGSYLLTLGAISVIFLSLSQVVAGMLQGIGKIVIPVIAAAFGVIVKIILNYVLIAIPFININGAVISTIFCYLTASGINLYFLARATKTKPDFMSILVKPLLSAAVMGLWCFVSYNLVLYIFPHNTAAVIFSILSGAVVYFIYLVVLKGVVKSDVSLLPFGRKIVNIMNKL